MSAARSAELAANLLETHARVASACASAGRNVDEVSVVAVSKTFPARDVIGLAELGHRDFGESRHQEAAAKVGEVGSTDRADLAELRWHFVGQLQRNKAAAVARYSWLIHSLDRAELVPVLVRAAEERGTQLHMLIQVDLDDPLNRLNPARGGVDPKQVRALAATIARADSLLLRGVMAVAPRGADPRAAFARLREISGALRDEHPGADVISAGMSGDLEAAIAEGSTLVRVGTALFGHRAGRVG